jgi:uncharacterized protein YbbC (DUF1343 family)
MGYDYHYSGGEVLSDLHLEKVTNQSRKVIQGHVNVALSTCPATSYPMHVKSMVDVQLRGTHLNLSAMNGPFHGYLAWPFVSRYMDWFNMLPSFRNELRDQSCIGNRRLSPAIWKTECFNPAPKS